MLPLLLALALAPPAVTLENPEVNESSGLAVSRRNPGVLWTHNDSGDGPFLYAFNRSGANLGTFRLTGARALDWEDMAAGPCPGARAPSCLYVGDTGDNGARRHDIEIYIAAEPAVDALSRGRRRANAVALPLLATLHLRYPDGPHDAESLLVHPRTGAIYVVTKQRSGPSRIFRVPSSGGLLQPVGTFETGSAAIPVLGTAFLITGGAISPDGRHAVLRDYLQAYEFTLPASERNFDRIWQTRPVPLELPPLRQGESVAYSLDGRTLLLTSEGLPAPLVEVRLKR
jgi:hypothetical protein